MAQGGLYARLYEMQFREADLLAGDSNGTADEEPLEVDLTAPAE